MFKKNDYTRYVFESINKPILMADDTLNILSANDCAKQFFSIEDEQKVQFYQLFEISKEDASNYFECAFSGLAEENYHLVARTNNAMCEVTFNPISDRKNHPVCMMIMVEDRTKELETVDSLRQVKVGLEQQLSDKNAQLESMTLQTVTTLANFIDSKNIDSAGHSSRVARYSGMIARELGWSDEEIHNLYYTSLLHDIGKVGNISDERNEKHTIIGAEILKDIKSIGNVGAGALYHHEHYDGSGYPYGLKGDEIPLSARIIGIANAFDVMTRQTQADEDTCLAYAADKIKEQAGKKYDPYLCEVVTHMIQDKSLGILKDDKEILANTNLLSESSRLVAKLIGSELDKTRKEAENDYLTNIWNRGTGERHISEYLKTADGALAIIDLDNFKRINDTFGHQMGDYALKLVADVLKIHSKNEFLCRMGGDEFMLFMRGVNTIDEAKQILDSIILTYNSKVEESHVLSHTSLSIGVALSSIEGRDYQQLFRCADRALYYVKQNGKKGYSFHNRAELSGENSQKPLLDIERLAFSIRNNVNYSGAYRVEYRQFMHTHEFIEKYAMRNNQSVQLVLLTIDYEHSVPLSVSEQEDVIEALERAVSLSLRGVDVSTRFSTSQMLLTLVDTSENNVTMVVRRILKEFYHIYSADRIIIKYETKDITMKAS